MAKDTFRKAATVAAAEADTDRMREKPEFGRIIVFAAAQEGRRRAGLEFSKAGTEVDFEEISQEQWELILDDPQLTIRPAKRDSKPAQDESELA